MADHETACASAFYDGYLTVIYGLVATKGLEKWVSVNSSFGISPFALIFFGVFVVGLHFWFTCATIEGRSARFYTTFVGSKWTNGLLLFDALIATLFAGLVLAMFATIPSNWKTLFGWALASAGVSFAYDLYSWTLVFLAKKRPSSDTEETIHDYETAIRGWFFQDGFFLIGAVLLFLYVWWNPSFDCVAKLGFVVVSVTVLVLDVKFLKP